MDIFKRRSTLFIPMPVTDLTLDWLICRMRMRLVASLRSLLQKEYQHGDTLQLKGSQLRKPCTHSSGCQLFDGKLRMSSPILWFNPLYVFFFVGTIQQSWYMSIGDTLPILSSTWLPYGQLWGIYSPGTGSRAASNNSNRKIYQTQGRQSFHNQHVCNP